MAGSQAEGFETNGISQQQAFPVRGDFFPAKAREKSSSHPDHKVAGSRQSALGHKLQKLLPAIWRLFCFSAFAISEDSSRLRPVRLMHGRQRCIGFAEERATWLCRNNLRQPRR